MTRKYSYSLWMLATYVTVFLYWKIFPSRAGFVLGGVLAVSFLLCGLVRAVRAKYFANRVDLCLHAYVIVDLCLETASFEAFKAVQPFAVMQLFHNNNNFIGCTLAFTALLGGYRWFALRGRPVTAIHGATCGQTGL